MNPSRLIYILITCLFFLGCATTHSVRFHPELVNSPGSIKTITIIPPKIHAEVQKFGDVSTTNPGKELDITKSLEVIIPKILISRGYSPVSLPFVNDTTNYSDNTFALLWEDYSLALSSIYPDRPSGGFKDVTRCQGSISLEPLNTFNQPESDAILLLNYYEVKQSTGRMTAGTAGGIITGVTFGAGSIPKPEYGYMSVALVSRITGNILWHEYSNIEIQSLKGVLRKLFRTFPYQNEDFTTTIHTGKLINNEVEISDSDIFQSLSTNRTEQLIDNNTLSSTWDDEVKLKDGLAIQGEIVNLTGMACMVERGETLYVIKRKKISKITYNGEVITEQELSKIDFPKVNTNDYKDTKYIH